MKANEAETILSTRLKHGQAVFSLNDLRSLFPERTEKTFTEGIRRLTRLGILTRAARGVYVNSNAIPGFWRLEEVASCLRQGHFNYVSLEFALSEFGAISQVPLGMVTVMTTGRRGLFRTIYGFVEFTHTARSKEDILAATLVDDYQNRPLRLARLETALRDLRRVGRNVYMVDMEEYHDILEVDIPAFNEMA